mmetsp:Transcript_11109/g.17457  ORF Transcript_11109/g.17457 Transcript_11109/m.17457 type:complete len:111 (-) Transcript_11109:30-362(-)
MPAQGEMGDVAADVPAGTGSHVAGASFSPAQRKDWGSEAGGYLDREGDCFKTRHTMGLGMESVEGGGRGKPLACFDPSARCRDLRSPEIIPLLDNSGVKFLYESDVRADQ